MILSDKPVFRRIGNKTTKYLQILRTAKEEECDVECHWHVNKNNCFNKTN